MFSPYMKDIENEGYQKGLNSFQRLVSNWGNDVRTDRRNIIDIITVVFGNDVQGGWINQCAEEVFKNQSCQNQNRLERFLGLLGPTGPLGKLLLACIQQPWPLKINMLPTHFQTQLGQFRKQQQVRRGLSMTNENPMSPMTQEYSKFLSFKDRLIEQDNCNINILECFMITTLVSLRRWNTVIPEYSAQQLYILDDFFYSLSHNPLLALIRRYLDFFAFNNKYEKQFHKYCFLIQQYFVRDIGQGIGSLSSMMLSPVTASNGTIFLQNRQIFKPNQKYQHYLHIVYLLIYYYRVHLQPKDMESYFSTLLTPQKSLFIQQGLLSQIMRVWLYYIRPYDRIQCQLVATLNSKSDRIYKVRRIPNKWYVDQNEEVKVNNQPLVDSYIFQQIIKSLAAAAKAKCFTWRQFNMLDAIMKYFNVKDEINQQKVIQNQNEAHYMLKDIQDWIKEWRTKPDRRLTGKEQIQIVQEMEEKMSQIWRGVRAAYQLDRFLERPRAESKRDSKRGEYPLIRRDEVRSSPWLAPIARYEFPPAFYLWMAVAKLIDVLLIRGLRSFPKTNLRWLTSYSSTLLLLVFVILMFVFKK